MGRAGRRGHELIASLRGRVVSRGTDHVVLEVNDVGYKVFVPRHPQEDDAHLHVHHVVREDGQFLYGFSTREELALFELLIGVSGVGPRAALAILSISRPGEIAAAIASGDAAALARAPGVGKKTAERLIVDLKGRVGGIARDGTGAPLPAAGDEVAQALVTLGFTAAEAAAAVREVPAPGSATSEERLAAALRRAASASR